MSEVPTPHSHASIAVIGSRGGVGTSTIAQNLASLLAAREESPICLLDCDHAFGSQALTFNIEPNQGLFACLHRESGALNDYAITLTDHLHLFCSNVDFDHKPNFTEQHSTQFLQQLAEQYGGFVLDLPRHEIQSHLELLKACSRVVIVTNQSLMGLRDSKRMMGALSLFAPHATINVVVNQIDKHAPELTQDEFERQLGKALDVTLPNVRGDIQQAQAMNKTLVQLSPKHKLAKTLDRLLNDVELDQVNLASSLGWQKLWRIDS